MIVISIGTERKLFTQNPTRDRILTMGNCFEQYHIVTLALKKDGFHQEIIGNAIIYPTNSSSKIWYIWDAIKVTYRIAKKLSVAEKQKTIITAQDPFECGFVGWVVAKMQNIKLHIQIHTDIFSPFFKNTWMQYIRMMIAPLIIRDADAIRCDSKRILDVIVNKKMNHAPIDVLPIYIATEKYATDGAIGKDVHDLFPERRTVFLVASRLEPEKDLQNTVTAFASVMQKYPNRAGLVIVGSGSCEQQLREQVRVSKIESDVVFIPWTNDLQSYYKTADVFMITSLFEGYGLTIAESLLCGTPVLATNVGVAPEVIIEGRTGWMCPPQNMFALGEKIEQLVAHPDRVLAAKKFLIEHPYVHAYANQADYQNMFIKNMEQAFQEK